MVEPTYAMHSLLARATGTRLVTRVQPRDQLLDPAAAADIPAWCRMRGHEYVGEDTAPDGVPVYTVRRRR